MSHFGRELRGFARGHVGKIGDNQVEPAFDRVEQMTLPKIECGPEGQGALRFRARARAPRGKVDGVELGVGKTGGEGKRDNAAARADIKHALDFPARAGRIDIRPVARFRGGG